jgi:hypothetical protein
MRLSRLCCECATVTRRPGTRTSYTFGELLREASNELDEQLHEIDRTGRTKWDDLLNLK